MSEGAEPGVEGQRDEGRTQYPFWDRAWEELGLPPVGDPIWDGGPMLDRVVSERVLGKCLHAVVGDDKVDPDLMRGECQHCGALVPFEVLAAQSLWAPSTRMADAWPVVMRAADRATPTDLDTRIEWVGPRFKSAMHYLDAARVPFREEGGLSAGESCWYVTVEIGWDRRYLVNAPTPELAICRTVLFVWPPWGERFPWKAKQMGLAEAARRPGAFSVRGY